MAKDYDSILTRLISILTKLSHNDLPTTKDLANEFNVTTRTIQNDIYKRLYNSFPILKDDLGRFKFEDGYSLDKSILNKKEMLVLSMALNTMSNHSFDTTSTNIIKKLLYPNFFNPYFIKSTQLEKIDTDSSIVKDIEAAIKSKNRLLLTCNINTNNTIEVEPYKITAFDGFWYLLAKNLHDNRIQTFMVSNISSVKVLRSYHDTHVDEIDDILNNIHSAFFDEKNLYAITIEVNSNISHYFLKKNFISSQKIIEKKEDNSLVVSFDVTHDEDIDNLIKSWLPDLKVVSPQRYKDKIKAELSSYLENI